MPEKTAWPWFPNEPPATRKALAPSLRQSELDQVQRVTALREPAESQPLVGTPLVRPAACGQAAALSTDCFTGKRLTAEGLSMSSCIVRII
jgi:hypothetical protein